MSERCFIGDIGFGWWTPIGREVFGIVGIVDPSDEGARAGAATREHQQGVAVAVAFLGE
jgi:hypothetical protein